MAISLLFPDRDAALAKIRRQWAFGPGQSLGITLDALDDDDLWEKLLTAEAWVAATLRVPLVPTRFFPKEPSQAQIDALPTGQPWAVDPPYDYDPANYRGDRWGMVALRQKPVQAIKSVKLVYPSPQHVVLDVPADWVKVDAKYGHMQLVPTSSPFLSPIGGLVMNSMAGGRMLPFAVEVDYEAGLTESLGLNTIIKDVILKRTMIVLLEDAFLPQSGSISADGLSQSISVQVDKFHDAVESALHGTEAGGNGGLMARIHGVRLMVC